MEWENERSGKTTNTPIPRRKMADCSVYLFSTRDDGEDYCNEMKDEDHIKLAELLNAAKGAVIVSGYDSDLYNELYKGWTWQYRTD
jgi:hypothetical protein